MNGLSLQGPPHRSWDSSVMQGGSVGTLDRQQSYREVKTLTKTVLNLEFADFFCHFWSQMTVYVGPWGDYMGS